MPAWAQQTSVLLPGGPKASELDYYQPAALKH